jgi:hypothetical protein
MISVKDLKEGMVVYECQDGANIKMTIMHDAERTASGWKATGITDKNTKINLYVHNEHRQYGPRLYTEPQYAKHVNGEWVFNNLDV